MFRYAILTWLFICGVALGHQQMVIVVDDSGSMADRMRVSSIRKIAAAKESLALVLQTLPTDAEVGVLALNRGWIMPLQQHDRDSVSEHVNQLRASGGTPLGTRMKEATDELLTRRADNPYGDYRLLVVTDGEASDQDVLGAVLPDIMSRNIVVDVIGVDMQSDHSLATEVTNYRRADDPGSLQQAIAESLAESDDSTAIGGESDFELLAGFPVDLAPTVIATLSKVDNTPIGGETVSEAELEHGRTVMMPPAQPRIPNNGGGGGRFLGVGFLFCIGVLLFVVSTLSSIFRQLTRPKRRRW